MNQLIVHFRLWFNATRIPADIRERTGGINDCPALLSLFGCKQEDVDSGTVGLINTPKGVLVTQRARCTGCHRCEISCTNYNDGAVGTFFSRIKSIAISSLAMMASGPVVGCMAI